MNKTKILIAIDEPNWANTIIYTTYNFIDRKNSEVTLLNVNESNVAEENLFYSNPEKFIKHEAEKSSFALLEDFLENSEVNYKGFIYKEGDAADTIINLTKINNYDLVVIGSHNKSIIERIFLGSVTHKVVRFAKSSVLIINSKYYTKINNLDKYSILVGVFICHPTLFMRLKNLHKFIDKICANIAILNITTPPSFIFSLMHIFIWI